MKKILLSVIAIVVGFLATPSVWGQVEVSVEEDFVIFQVGYKFFISSVESPTNLVAVRVVYPNRDFSEYILSPGGFELNTFPREHNNRRAGDKEWAGLEKEWKKLQKQVTFRSIWGKVKVNTFAQYTLVDSTVTMEKETPHAFYVFKVKYLNSGKEGTELISLDRFKTHPNQKDGPFFLGTDNGMLVPVFKEENGRFVAKIAD